MAKKIIAKENVYTDYRKIFRYGFIIFIGFIFLCFNYCTLEDLLGSNNTYIKDFQKPHVEDMSIKETSVAGFFYASDKKLLDEQVFHYMKENISKKPSMIIVPNKKSDSLAEITDRAYVLLKPYAKEIKTVFIIEPSSSQDLEGIALTSKDFFKTQLGNISVDTKIVKEIVDKNPKAKIFDKAYEKQSFIKHLLPLLQKNLEGVQIVPITYAKFSGQELADILEPYVLKADTLIIFYADISRYYDDQVSDEKTGISSALILSKKNDFYPKTINLKNLGDIMGEKDNALNQVNDEENKERRGLDDEVESLQNFADLYKKELISVVNISLEDVVSGDDILYKPSRDEYSKQMFDKGASFVTLIKNGEIIGSKGTIVPSISIAQDVANSAYESAIKNRKNSKLVKDELKDIDFSISLLTSLEKIKYFDEKDLISKVQEGLDGLVIVDGNRQGILLPNAWKKATDKQDFLKELKLSAGISPIYWSNKIKIYRFRTVEVSKNQYF